jgi:hypothetical protein
VPCKVRGMASCLICVGLEPDLQRYILNQGVSFLGYMLLGMAQGDEGPKCLISDMCEVGYTRKQNAGGALISCVHMLLVGSSHTVC